MNKKEKVLKETRKNPLVDAVIRQMGGSKVFLESYKDVLTHGAENGYSGFTWTDDNVRFIKKNLLDIFDALQDLKAEGVEIGDFNSLDKYAWFALEWACQRYEDALMSLEDEQR